MLSNIKVKVQLTHCFTIYWLLEKKHTCRTKAEEDNERAAPITTASSTLLIFTCTLKLTIVAQWIQTRISNASNGGLTVIFTLTFYVDILSKALKIMLPRSYSQLLDKSRLPVPRQLIWGLQLQNETVETFLDKLMVKNNRNWFGWRF